MVVAGKSVVLAGERDQGEGSRVATSLVLRKASRSSVWAGWSLPCEGEGDVTVANSAGGSKRMGREPTPQGDVQTLKMVVLTPTQPKGWRGHFNRPAREGSVLWN